MVGIGGGSPIDICKVASVLAANPGPVAEYFGIDLVPGPGLPFMVIPTTAGTGSEVTPIAILSDEQEKLKKGIVSPYLFPTVALLDPELTLGLPPRVTAATGMDALIHAVEAFTSQKRQFHDRRFGHTGHDPDLFKPAHGFCRRRKPKGALGAFGGQPVGRHGVRQRGGYGGARLCLSHRGRVPHPPWRGQQHHAGTGDAVQHAG